MTTYVLVLIIVGASFMIGYGLGNVRGWMQGFKDCEDIYENRRYKV